MSSFSNSVVEESWTTYNQSVFIIYQSYDDNNIADNLIGLHANHHHHHHVSSTTTNNNCLKNITTNGSNVGNKETHCKSFKWIIGGWTECMAQFFCGKGIQNRTVLCVRTTDSVPVPDDKCLAEPPIHTRSCLIPCPQDCIVSIWSTWSECLPEKCRLEKAKQRDGYRLRIRGVVQEGLHGGAECPHLHALQPCEYQACYSWRINTSDQCTVSLPGMSCGEGIRNKTVECINLHGERVAAKFCPEPRPATEERCVAPCLNDCLLSEWNEWTPCSQMCSLGRMVGHRTRLRDVLASSGPGGSECPPLRLVLEKERCGEIPCFTYHWQKKDWGECRTHASSKCGVGVQYKEIYCVESSGERVSTKRCLSEYAPNSSQNCTVPCPVDCVVSIFTDWTVCPVNCLTDDAAILPEQHRYRFVLEYPSHGGLQCPHRVETQPCSNLARCIDYTWQMSNWSPCIFPNPGDNCGNGYRTRDVRCLDKKEEEHTDAHCLSQRQKGIKPVVVQPCYVTCNQEPCVFSDWSQWSSCSKRCHGIRMRARTIEGLTSHAAECLNRNNHPINETESCNHCPDYMVKLIGQWSDCILDQPMDILDTTSSEINSNLAIGQMRAGHRYCGIGRRFHSIVCADQLRARNVSALVCNSVDYTEEMCFIPCLRDCQLSQWSPWTSCLTSQRCGNGQRKRSRYLIETNLDGGRDCPPLVDGEEYQTLPCHISCEEYNWTYGEWSICTTLSGLSSGHCGAGLQSRGVRCARLSADGEVTEVNERLCDKKMKPREINYCQIPCPGQCAVTVWSEWTKCPEQCMSQMRRHRFRSIIRHPEPADVSVQCPLLEEFERCDLDVRCQIYSIRWTDWSPCIPYQNMTCGSGLRQRFIECIRNDGNYVVSKEFCINSGHGPEMEMPGDESCSVLCPIDCIVSEWSLWSSCSLTCGLGFQTRSRSVLVQPDHRGRHCPQPLLQKKYCPYAECFRWHTSDWGQCEIEKDSCGYGRQRRQLKCVRLDGTFTDLELCDPRLLTKLTMTDECYVPCPGDCEVSEWSSWGPCHRPCDHGNDMGFDGRQTRSRVVLSASSSSHRQKCPLDLIETKTCQNEGHCPQYRWHAGMWIGNKRQVWCQDINGRKVFGACKESEKPSTAKSCLHPCPVPYSECRDLDSCVCSRGYNPVYKGGHLIRCEEQTADRMLVNKHERSSNLALYHPYDMSSDIWMYSILAAGLAFVILLVITVYVLCWRSRLYTRGRRPLTSTIAVANNDTLNDCVVSNPYKEPNDIANLHDTSKESFKENIMSFKGTKSFKNKELSKELSQQMEVMNNFIRPTNSSLERRKFSSNDEKENNLYHPS